MVLHKESCKHTLSIQANQCKACSTHTLRQESGFDPHHQKQPNESFQFWVLSGMNADRAAAQCRIMAQVAHACNAISVVCCYRDKQAEIMVTATSRLHACVCQTPRGATHKALFMTTCCKCRFPLHPEQPIGISSEGRVQLTC